MAKKDAGWDWMTGKTQDLGGQGVLAPKKKKEGYHRPRGVDGVTYRNQRKSSALEDAGKIAKELGAQDTLHHGGKHVKLDSFGHPVDAAAPTGIDWLLANGPNRQSVKDREQAMTTPMADKQAAVKRNLGFKQEEIQNRHPFQRVQDNGQGMKMAFGRDGQPVGFSTEGESSLHVGKNPSVHGETWGPSQQEVKQSIDGAVEPWQQGLWTTTDKNREIQLQADEANRMMKSAPAIQIQDNVKAPLDFFGAGNSFGPAQGQMKSQNGGAQKPAPIQAQPQTLPYPQDKGVLPKGLWPQVKHGANIFGGLLSDMGSSMIMGEPGHAASDAEKAARLARQSQAGYQPPSQNPANHQVSYQDSALNHPPYVDPQGQAWTWDSIQGKMVPKKELGQATLGDAASEVWTGRQGHRQYDALMASQAEQQDQPVPANGPSMLNQIPAPGLRQGIEFLKHPYAPGLNEAVQGASQMKPYAPGLTEILQQLYAKPKFDGPSQTPFGFLNH